MRFRLLSILGFLALGACGSYKDSSSVQKASAAQCQSWYKSAYDLYAKADALSVEATKLYIQADSKLRECNPIIDFLLMSTCKNAATKLREAGNDKLRLANSYTQQGTGLLNMHTALCY